MNFRKNSTLIVGGAVAGLLLIVAIVFLVVSRGAYLENQSRLDSARNRLDSLNNRNPYPSAENVEAATANLDMLTNRYEALIGELEQNQLKAVSIEPSRFAPMLEQAVLRLRRKSEEAKIALPGEPGLGFKDYAAGKLPSNDPKVLERIVVQISALEDLFNQAIDAKVTSIDAVQRDDFELRATVDEAPEPAVRGRGRGRVAARGVETAPVAKSYVAGVPMPPSDPRYRVERFVLGVTGRESAIWDFLNRLVSSKIIYSIADVSFESTKTDSGKPVDMKSLLTQLQNEAKASAQDQSRAGGGQVISMPPELKMEEIPKEIRRVAGRELIKARLVVDMFRFVDAASAEEAP